MGLFYVGCRVLNPVTSKSTAVRRLLVDTGAESTWIDAAALEAMGIERRKKDLQFQLANGQIVTRSVGYAVLMVDKSETVDEVVFAEAGDLQKLGGRALAGLNLQVDARRKRLVAAGRSLAQPPCLRDSYGWCGRTKDRKGLDREAPTRTAALPQGQSASRSAPDK
jgi:predicted aspartyl protease